MSIRKYTHEMTVARRAAAAGEGIVELIRPRNLIHVPAALAACHVCGGTLFAFVPAFYDDGEPVESEIYVGCEQCDENVEDPSLSHVREWVHRNFRVVR